MPAGHLDFSTIGKTDSLRVVSDLLITPIFWSAF